MIIFVSRCFVLNLLMLRLRGDFLPVLTSPKHSHRRALSVLMTLEFAISSHYLKSFQEKESPIQYYVEKKDNQLYIHVGQLHDTDRAHRPFTFTEVHQYAMSSAL